MATRGCQRGGTTLRETHGCLYQHVVMQHTEGSRQIDNAMQTEPALAAQTLDHLIGRSDRQRNHQKKCGHANRYEWTPGHVTGNGLQMEEAIEREVSHQVQRAVEKCKQAEHAAKAG